MSRFVKHEPCPECGSRDNLGRYSDGSAFCFGCGYKERATSAPFIGKEIKEEPRTYQKIPDDAGHDFSQECVAWLQQYDVGVPEAITRGLKWSPSRQQLVFDMDQVWQARNFAYSKHGNTGKSKYFTQGDVNECLTIYFTNNRNGSDLFLASDSIRAYGEALVLVEDCVSSLRIARQCDSMPILGSHIAMTKIYAIARLYSSLIVWLDHDKLKEAKGIASKAGMLGLSSKVVYTELDPKCYTDNEIKEFIKCPKTLETA